MRFPSALSFFPALVAIIIALPAGATLLILGQSAFSRPAWQQLFSWPGLTHSVALSLLSTLVATLIALMLALSLCQRRAFTGRFSTLLLGMPHIALATGLILLLAPSGWLLRLFSPWLSGFEQPPDWPLINDPCAITLTLLLIMKETPFLFLMARNQCEHIDTLRQLQTGSALGYPPTQTWWRIVVPQLLPGLRLPVFCVLAFSLSAADIGILLGPQRPPTLATLIWQWSVDPRLAMQDLAGRLPAELSGGQRARISVLRTLLSRPQALALDEPFSRLDKPLRRHFRQWVFERITQAGIPALLVTHDDEDIPPGGSVIQLTPHATG
ncbi:ABC transporter family protein [Enterobacillus tribolii]|uniref:ABC transporter family protein n=1 Tax=Enterobacillus tribolii TaxID=1487935 RepID=A0A370R4Q7_9GAMM|nr:ATP-binding cassette domain-containing protein [Enterobacillus tribolii]RDK97095.1 ABC transporter family protein [Enterobacillus tribolii]